MNNKVLIVMVVALLLVPTIPILAGDIVMEPSEGFVREYGMPSEFETMIWFGDLNQTTINSP